MNDSVKIMFADKQGVEHEIETLINNFLWKYPDLQNKDLSVSIHSVVAEDKRSISTKVFLNITI